MIMELLTYKKAVPGDQSPVKYWYCKTISSSWARWGWLLSGRAMIIFVWFEQNNTDWTLLQVGRRRRRREGRGERGRSQTNIYNNLQPSCLFSFFSPLLSSAEQSSHLTSTQLCLQFSFRNHFMGISNGFFLKKKTI